jgi:Rps23 Pro-64 3,4-dihydroxylase Tpa1-like proline 4-hydroxylase
MIREHLFNKAHPAYSECREIEKEITDSIIAVSKDYESMHPGLDIGMLCPLSISKYFVGSMMGKHTDTHDDDEGKTVSVVLYLNDDYTGGEIELPDHDIVVKPTPGSIVVFPSRKPYFHQSNTILSGEKYIVPGFWENRVKFQTGWTNG